MNLGEITRQLKRLEDSERYTTRALDLARTHDDLRLANPMPLDAPTTRAVRVLTVRAPL